MHEMTGLSENELLQFDPNFFECEKQISYIGTGSLGGKAHGLAFINNVLDSEINLEEFPGFEIRIPKMIIICLDIFDSFMKQNDLYQIALSDSPDDRIALAFQKANLPFEILGDLRTLIFNVHKPLAVRSSSMLEDAMYEPFAGIYGTKMIPNNQHDIDTRFRKLVEAIKYVYASTYFKAAKDYIKATKHKTEDEKMAVIIQEMVGSRFGDNFYPEISGVAHSYNFYTSGHAKPEEGVVNLALGLGKTIVDGGISWTYSPSFPQTNPPFGSPRDMLKQTQTNFWAVNMGKPPQYDPINETEYMFYKNILEAEADGTLKHIVSTYDSNSDRVWPGLSGEGPRILTFAPILIHNEIPLNSLIKTLLKVSENALEAPVEIEFALTFTNDKNGETQCRFGFLQVRPMVVSTEEVKIEPEELTGNQVLVASESVLGNGIIENIKDIVYLIPDDFDTRFTKQMADEVESINNKLIKEGRPYVLIGFGRWGTTDPSAGIPVQWGQISGAKIIIEAALENIFIEMSQGAHFFHNVTGFKVCYFSIPFTGKYSIDWDWLTQQNLIEETRFVNHVRTEKALRIKVDGRAGKGLISKY